MACECGLTLGIKLISFHWVQVCSTIVLKHSEMQGFGYGLAILVLLCVLVEIKVCLNRYSLYRKFKAKLKRQLYVGRVLYNYALGLLAT